jgi:hypothetical protein
LTSSAHRAAPIGSVYHGSTPIEPAKSTRWSAATKLPDLLRVEVRIRVVEVDPGVEPDPRSTAVGDDLARRVRRTAGVGCRGEHGLLERRALEQLGHLVVGRRPA